MSTLKSRLRADRDAARRNGEELPLSTLGNVLGQIDTREKSGKAPVELTDPQVEALLRKEAATRRDTARIMADAGKPDRAERENTEADVIDAYLPKMLTGAEVFQIIDKAIAQVTADLGEKPGPRQMGQVMKPVTAEIAGRFDGKQVAGLVKSRLG